MQVGNVEDSEVDFAVSFDVLVLEEELSSDLAPARPCREAVACYVSYIHLLGFFIFLSKKQRLLIFVEEVHLPHF